MVLSDSFPWIIVRDLNKVLDDSKKLGGRDLRVKRLFLKDFLQNTGALDLGHLGCKFTQVNNQDDKSLIRERLDRAVASVS